MPARGPQATWVLDLDGVVWLLGDPIPGAAEAVTTLRSAGVRVLFVTNNASPTVAELVGALAGVGIEVAPDDLLGSARAAATLVRPGDRVLVVGEEGLREALVGRGVELVERAPADAVVVARSPRFDYEMLTTASEAVRRGARLLGTNEDATYPTPDGQVPGAGSILAAVATAAGVTPEVAGKPHRPMVGLIAAVAWKVDVVVGDRPSTDGRLAQELGARFALVLTGVTDAAAAAEAGADICAADLAEVVQRLVSQADESH